MLKLNGYVFLFIVVFFFSGCATLPSTLPLPTEAKKKTDVLYLSEPGIAASDIETKPELSDRQVLSSAKLGTTALDTTFKNLPENLKKFIPKIGESVKSEEQKSLTLTRFEMKELVKALLEDIPLFLNNAEVIKAASEAKRNQVAKDEPPNIELVLFNYYQAYFKGKFITRQGEVLSKPAASISFTDNKITGSIDNNTLSGFVTVFLEAIYDFICPTPVFYSVDNKPEYEAIYVKVNKNLKTYNKQKPPSDELYTLYYTKKIQDPEKPKKNYFNGNKNEPTASKLGPVKSCELTKGDCKHIMEKHVNAMHFISSLSATQSKHLAGLIIRDFGGANLGIAFANVDFSIGNNDALAKIVETCFEVSVRRTTEFGLYNSLKKQDKSDMINRLMELIDKYDD